MGPEPEIVARGEHGSRAWSTVNPVNTQFSDRGRLSMAEKGRNQCMFEFPAIFTFLTPNKARNFSGTFFLSNRENDREQFFGPEE